MGVRLWLLLAFALQLTTGVCVQLAAALALAVRVNREGLLRAEAVGSTVPMRLEVGKGEVEGLSVTGERLGKGETVPEVEAEEVGEKVTVRDCVRVAAEDALAEGDGLPDGVYRELSVAWAGHCKARWSPEERGKIRARIASSISSFSSSPLSSSEIKNK